MTKLHDEFNQGRSGEKIGNHPFTKTKDFHTAFSTKSLTFYPQIFLNFKIVKNQLSSIKQANGWSTAIFFPHLARTAPLADILRFRLDVECWDNDPGLGCVRGVNDGILDNRRFNGVGKLDNGLALGVIETLLFVTLGVRSIPPARGLFGVLTPILLKKIKHEINRL